MDEILIELHKHYTSSLHTRLGQLDSRVYGLDALFIWQFVRYSKSYQIQYDGFKEDWLDKTSRDIFAYFFGMSEPVDYRHDELPLGFYFQQNIVKFFDIRHFLSSEEYQKKTRSYLAGFILPQLQYFSIEDNDPALAFVVNLKDDPDTVTKMIHQELLEKRKERKLEPPNIQDDPNSTKEEKEIYGNEFFKIRGNFILIDWLITYYYRKCRKMSYSEVAKKHSSLTGKNPDSTQIKIHVKNFRKLSAHSPKSFFWQKN